jgi:hypothetical protein
MIDYKELRKKSRRAALLSASGFLIVILTFIFSSHEIKDLFDKNEEKKLIIKKKGVIIDSLQSDISDLKRTNSDLKKELGNKIFSIDAKSPNPGKSDVANYQPIVVTEDSIDSVTLPNPLFDPILQEYNAWIGGLTTLKENLLKELTAESEPEGNLKLTKVLKVKEYGKTSDTRIIDDWEFNSSKVHLIGIRRNQLLPRIFDQARNEALFILLVNGRTFKFLGTTGPFVVVADSVQKRKGRVNAAFLADGQHKYRLEATNSLKSLTPSKEGVLIFRDRDDDNKLTAFDIKAGLDPNPNHNVKIQWHEKGQGAQLISGEYYINPSGRLINCSSFLTSGTGEISKGAFGILIDLIWTQTENEEIYYTVLDESYFDKESKEKIDEAFNLLITARP